MPDDQHASELISRSLAGQLSSEQQHVVEQRLKEDPQSRNFARLSRLIQDSLSDVARRTADGDTTVAPGLPEDAKSRIRQSIRSESARRSQVHSTTAQTPTGALMPTITGRGPVTWSGSTGASDSDFDIRQMTSRFTLIRKLGEGGLGTVWLARDEKLKRSVALKEMNPAAAEFPRAWERFHREAEITGHLEHPNVVPMYQFGTDTVTGHPFYAMRFVGKRTLVDAIEEYHDRKAAGEDVTMDLHRLLTAFIGVCQAIAYAHSRGVIHRDLKPENVALDNFGQVIVLDWGLAKVSDEYETEGVLSGESFLADSNFGKTMAGEVIGTPLYMAPEQAAGDLRKIDNRTDVYGLGAILFAMLAGVAPHQNSSLKQGNAVPVPELLQKVANEPSPRPRDHSTDIPTDLEAICRKAMHFKPHTRYQSATEVADAVQQWMAGRSQRRQVYSNSRGEGRELRTAMQSAVRDLERNVRFMSSLPPIQGIVDALNDRPSDTMSVWRERLAVIFGGLLRTNCDFCAVSFARVEDGKFQELIRLERQASDPSSVRSIPGSRLASGPVTACMSKALDGHPDEVSIALSTECPEERRLSRERGNRLAAGVPVFDARTEELFGFVMIEACLERLIESQIRIRFTTTRRLFVLDNECRVLIQFDRHGGRVRDNDGKPISEISSCWSTLLPQLKERGEFVDEQDHAVYATRIDLVPGRYSLALLLCLAEKPNQVD
ncbi:MAG: serine/threonine-protein kinase [Fuerstiella sp.]